MDSEARVFISYAREDYETAKRLYDDLKRAGAEPWLDDEDLLPGQNWKLTIKKAIKNSSHCLVLLSSDSVSKKGYMQKELKLAMETLDEIPEGDIFVIPVRVDDCKVKNERLRELHWVDLFRSYEKSLEKIQRVFGVEEKNFNKEARGGGERSTRPDRDVNPSGKSGCELVRIPGGVFMMGSPEDEEGRYDAEGPLHEVHVPEFYIGRYPVTNEEYGRFLDANPDAPVPGHWADRQFNQPGQPVVGVSWKDAKRYAAWVGLCLPSEAQWEYACRAGTDTRYYTGDAEADLDRAGWYGDNSGRRLHPVGIKEANAFGLYDMHGNVWEWVEDDWHENYQKAPDNGSVWVDNPRGPERVLRGGGWNDSARRCRTALRGRGAPGARFRNVGFRLAGPPGP